MVHHICRRAPRWLLAALLTVVAISAGARGARAEPDPDQIAMGIEATAEIRGEVADGLNKSKAALGSAQVALAQVSDRRDAAQGELDRLTLRAQEFQARVGEMDRQLQSKDEELNETRRRLQRAAAELWMAHAGTVVSESPSDAYLETVRRDRYGRATGGVPRELIAKFNRQRSELEILRDRADEVRAAAEVERRTQERVVLDLSALVSAAERGVALAQAKLDRWRSIESAPATPMMSASSLTPAEIAGWFRTTGRQERLGVDDKGGPMDIEKLATYFVEEGQRYGIRGDVAFAQAIHETGYFSFPDYGQVRPGDNNFAGIGACNSCETGYRYPNARIGVRAQMQLLRNYADPAITAATLPGGDQPLFPNYDRFFLRGVARVWTDLNGRWAVPGTTYGQAIHRTYLRMFTWAIEQMTLPPPAPQKAATRVVTTTTAPPTGADVLSRPATPVGQ